VLSCPWANFVLDDEPFELVFAQVFNKAQEHKGINGMGEGG